MGDPKKKNEETVSSIVVDEFSSAVPGVTMLLNPQVILEREASRVKMERSDPVAETFSPDNEGIVLSSPSAAEPVAQTVFDDTPLSQLGVLLELHFEDEGAGFRFLKIVPHAQGPAAEWQEVAYRGMRIELDVLGINISFQEFSAKKDSFHADAFCAADDAWIQIVRSREHSTRMYVLITRRSLLLEKEKVYTLLEGSGEKESGDDSDGGGIEIDFAS